MIVVAIIGILASIAIPAYQGYIDTANASSALASITDDKTKRTITFHTDGTGLATGNTLSASEGRATVTLTATVDASSADVSWACAVSPTSITLKNCP